MNNSTKSLFWQAINMASKLNLINALVYERQLFLARARRALKRNLANPGDCAGDEKLLVSLAIAEAQVGRGQGWIPETQRIAILIADKL